MLTLYGCEETFQCHLIMVHWRRAWREYQVLLDLHLRKTGRSSTEQRRSSHKLFSTSYRSEQFHLQLVVASYRQFLTSSTTTSKHYSQTPSIEFRSRHQNGGSQRDTSISMKRSGRAWQQEEGSPLQWLPLRFGSRFQRERPSAQSNCWPSPFYHSSSPCDLRKRHTITQLGLFYKKNTFRLHERTTGLTSRPATILASIEKLEIILS